jgi:adenylate kinase family enzyme
MRRVLVIGGNGAGKSYFSIALSEKTGIPLVHLDRLKWREGWQSASREEFDTLLAAELEKPEWIIDGNFQRTMPWRLEYADTVFYFDFSTVKCVFGVLGRVRRNYGKSRPDMGGGNVEKLDFTFLKDVLRFRRRNSKRTKELLGGHPEIAVTVFRSRRQAERFLKEMKEGHYDT